MTRLFAALPLAALLAAPRFAQAFPAELQAAQSALRAVLGGGAAPSGVPAFSAGPAAATAGPYGVTEIPKLVLIDEEGRVVYEGAGSAALDPAIRAFKEAKGLK